MPGATFLHEIGWDEGFAIPVANAENKALEDELLRKQKEKSDLDGKLCTHRDKIQAMGEHLKNVRQELSHTQALSKAKEKETESEVHFKALAEREMGRLQQEISKLERELGAMRDKKNTQENNIFKASQKLDELKSQMNWDQKALDAWLEESARKDEDTMVIVKYAQQDESRIRELTVRMEKMTIEASQKRRALDNELTETITAQIGLDSTAENFRQAHAERQELIRQWESTIEQMRRRDREMEQYTLLLAQVNQEVREKEATIKEKKNFLDREVENNRELERKIAAAERLASKLRQELQEKESNRVRLQDELESLRFSVDGAATEVQAKRSQLSSMKKDIVEKSNKVKAAQASNATLQEKLQCITETAVSVEERAVQMEQTLKENEQAVKETDSLLLHHREALFKKTQELEALKARETETKAEITGCRASLSNLNSRLNKMDQTSLKQQKIIYNQDFQIQQLERKISRLKGEVTGEEKWVLEAKVSDLSEALEEKRTTSSMLMLQLKRLQDNIRCMQKEMEKTGVEKSDLTTKIEELDLFNDTSDKELKKLNQKKQDAMVEDNILKLETKRLRDLLYNKADSVLSLEKQRLWLQAVMSEREEELKLHREMICKQVRLAEQEQQALSVEVHERLFKIDKMKKRYEILTVSMAAPEGEEERSQAYYIIKAAQEKEEVQRKGDDLDAKIGKAEKEIQALENTLHVVNSRNTTYRKSFHKVEESSEEYQEKLRLEEQKRAVEERYKHKRRQMKELQDDIQNMKNTLEILNHDEAAQSQRTEETRSQLLILNKELSLQKEKLDRVKKQCSKLTREIQSARKTKEESSEERDINLRELRDFNRTVNKMLLEAMQGHPDLRDAIDMYFQQASLPLPSPTPTLESGTSSKPSSGRSSASSLRWSAGSSSSRGSSSVQAAPPPAVRTVDLGMGLSVTSAPGVTPSPRDSRPGSGASGSSRSGGSVQSQKVQWKSP
ncbi:coiled-coil domain-containing protein 39 isoform X2 [Brienomyrus brachyistius]|uniref:coiled-coil domain-containing protein 39 isoform X1 n=1 Tax=Brienomyrus brachyistius TaxID=42636 RepID=UPI0020B381E7|nr:coiled-coil domain-containing protein 39 isoform X1 [Brienomyrus brachyistius]XP_048844373.1 coiled-coil domain-containing protein 39 isoform X2 [Brienomyrus brachyistius]